MRESYEPKANSFAAVVYVLVTSAVDPEGPGVKMDPITHEKTTLRHSALCAYSVRQNIMISMLRAKEKYSTNFDHKATKPVNHGEFAHYGDHDEHPSDNRENAKPEYDPYHPGYLVG